MVREERTTAENETSRNHTVQIEQLEAKARLQNERRTNETGERNQSIEGNNEIAE